MSFVEELQRRNVIRVAVAYIVIAWLVAQVLQLVFESFVAPVWVMKTVLVLLATGFPLALFFSWAFEITPEGVKREHEVDRSRSITTKTGRRLNIGITVVLALSVAYFTYDKLILSAQREAALVEATTVAVAEQLEAEQQTNVKAGKSIAVLPFVNMSSDKEQEYFSDGLSEELLNLLAKIPELQVAARTSSFSLKGKDIHISEVGEILNVAHVLEGSVRKSGNQVRITAQLIKVDDGYHLWSDTYDRSLDNIFAIQDEIASEVVTQLKLTLLNNAPTDKEVDPDAYTLFLQARHLTRQGTEESLNKARSLLQEALVIDPLYAAAWEELGYIYIQQINRGLRPIEEGTILARNAINKALEADPQNATAFANLGLLTMLYDGDLSASAGHLEHSLLLEPTNIDNIRIATTLLESLDRNEEAIKLGRYVTSRDPASPSAFLYLGQYYTSAGLLDESIEAYGTVLTLTPGYAAANYFLSRSLLLKGDAEAALKAMQAEQSAWKLIGMPMVYHALGQNEASDTALAELIEKLEKAAAYNIAYVLAYRGEADRAFDWLEKAARYNDPGLSQILGESLFENIHSDPRWLLFLESIGKLPEQLKAIEFEVTLPK